MCSSCMSQARIFPVPIGFVHSLGQVVVEKVEVQCALDIHKGLWYFQMALLNFRPSEFCEETAEVSVGKVIVSPILGKSSNMMPKSVHAALLRKKGPERSVM